MRSRFTRHLGVVGVLVACLLGIAALIAAQTSSTLQPPLSEDVPEEWTPRFSTFHPDVNPLPSVDVPTDWTPPRTPDGQPDIQGFYTPEDWIGDIAPPPPPPGSPPPARTDVMFGLHGSHIIDPPDGQLPIQPWAAERRRALDDTNNGRTRTVNVEDLDPQTRCLLPGVPRSNWSTPYSGFQFIQVPGYVVILGEWNHHYRIIPLDRPRHLGPEIHLYMGDSVGHWEGNTLVVDTTNLEGLWLDQAGTFYSDDAHVTEQFTIIDPNTINIRATIDDPQVYTRPWTVEIIRRRAPKDYRLFEYACAEGNQALDIILAKPKGD